MDYVDNITKAVKRSFISAYKNKQKGKNITNNQIKSATFVSKLALQIEHLVVNEGRIKTLVQKVDDYGNKMKGEWLFDAAIVEVEERKTDYRNRRGNYIKRIIWAIESEFSTNIEDFLRDFSKLIHVKADHYLYINGVNQAGKDYRGNYIKAQIQLAREIVKDAVKTDFYIGFVPSPGKNKKQGKSIWDSYDLKELLKWIHVEKIG